MARQKYFVYSLQLEKRHKGMSAVYTVILLTALSGFVALGVDFGRVQVAKMQLITAADAAALYAAGALPNGTVATARAVSAAASNNVDGSPVVLLPSDVEIGYWDIATRQFTNGGSPANAVRVAVSRTAARGNAIPLVFAQLMGANSCNVNGLAIAMIDTPASPYGIVGINWFRSQGLLTVDSYPSGNKGDVASNGNITLNLLGLVGITNIEGDVHPGQGMSIIKPAISLLTHISGSTAPLTAALYYPPVVVGAYATNNDNQQLPLSIFNGADLSGAISTDIPGGTYVVHDLTLLANLQLRLRGPTTFYVTGTTNLLGTILVPNSDPANFKVYVVGSNPVNLTANVATYMDLYAPQSPIQVIAGLGYYGRMVGASIDILGTSFIHYDEALGPPAGSPRVKLVK